MLLLWVLLVHLTLWRATNDKAAPGTGLHKIWRASSSCNNVTKVFGARMTVNARHFVITPCIPHLGRNLQYGQAPACTRPGTAYSGKASDNTRTRAMCNYPFNCCVGLNTVLVRRQPPQCPGYCAPSPLLCIGASPPLPYARSAARLV